MRFNSLIFVVRNRVDMDLQTVVQIEKPDFNIVYPMRMMLVGSCFVENIGNKLEYFGFYTDINPCGVVYNPLSVANTLYHLLDGKTFSVGDLWHRRDMWGSFEHHGRFSASSAEACLEKINGRMVRSSEELKNTDLLVITWGTAWVYRYNSTGRVVANCHCFPAADFSRYRLEVDEIVSEYKDLLSRLKQVRPSIRVLFTISPIRHWKDGAHGNQVSKAVLMLAVERLCGLFDFVYYFPSYEIVMDELRDYRFYAEDMLHVSAQGIEYIWERFSRLYMGEATLADMKRVDKLRKFLLHRPNNPDNKEYIRQRAATEDELEKLLDDLRKNSGRL